MSDQEKKAEIKLYEESLANLNRRLKIKKDDIKVIESAMRDQENILGELKGVGLFDNVWSVWVVSDSYDRNYVVRARDADHAREIMEKHGEGKICEMGNGPEELRERMEDLDQSDSEAIEEYKLNELGKGMGSYVIYEEGS